MGNSAASDSMVRRLENELHEKENFCNEVIHRAQTAGRDLSDDEKDLLSEKRDRMSTIKDQIETIESVTVAAHAANRRIDEVGREMAELHRSGSQGPVEYRSAGAFAMDMYGSALGRTDCRERLEIFHRAASHQRTSDTPGIIPDPIVGSVVNFTDGARPVVGFLGPQPLPGASWHRPKVTQHTTVGKQGVAGAAADEKSELVSQKMTISRIPASAVTYGGYVNVSRQDIDFANPSGMDAVVNDLALQFALQTEAAAGAALIATTNEIELATAVSPAVPTVDHLEDALWAAVAAIYNATKGAGALAVVVNPSKLPVWGKAFSPYTMNQDGRASGLNVTAAFQQGVVGNIRGIPVLVSAGLGGAATDYGVVLSSAAIEVYEQRVGLLQVTEPSVLGVQVAYAGYFTPMVIEAGGIQRIVNEVT